MGKIEEQAVRLGDQIQRGNRAAVIMACIYARALGSFNGANVYEFLAKLCEELEIEELALVATGATNSQLYQLGYGNE